MPATTIAFDSPVAFDAAVPFDGGAGVVPAPTATGALFGRFRRPKKDYSQTDRRIQAERLAALKTRRRHDVESLFAVLAGEDDDA